MTVGDKLMKAMQGLRPATYILIAASLVALLASACKPGPVGIFASIAAEKDINANRTTAFDGSSPSFVGQIGSGGSAAYFAIIGDGSLWTRSVSSTDWVEATLTGLPAEAAARKARSAAVVKDALSNSELYVAFGDSARGIWESSGGASWSSVDAAFSVDKTIDSLLAAGDSGAGDQLFVVTRADVENDGVITTSYTVWYLNSGSFAATGVSGIAGRPTAMAFDGSGYWLIAGQQVFRGPATTMAVVSGTPTETFGGIVRESDSAANMIAATTSGKLYRHDGAAWSVASAVFSKSDRPHAFAALTTVNFTIGGTGKSILLAGTQYGANAAAPAGYLEFPITVSGFDPATASPQLGTDFAGVVNVQTSVQANYVIALPAFSEPDNGQRVFALTIGNGLWSNRYDGTKWLGWIRE
jgi:hypothetical protein